MKSLIVLGTPQTPPEGAKPILDIPRDYLLPT